MATRMPRAEKQSLSLSWWHNYKTRTDQLILGWNNEHIERSVVVMLMWIVHNPSFKNSRGALYFVH